ncbi:MAG TPA: hypothetical protein VN915_09985 [Elusimicrobiota bacterium]|nr:hypothetical protein [Elusimicrobiota bacterium]
MNQTIRRAVLRTAALASLAMISPFAAAQAGPEALSVAAEARFQTAALEAGSVSFRPTLSAGMPRLAQGADEEFLGELQGAASLLTPGAFHVLGAAQAGEMDLAALYDRHLKTSLRYQLSGKTVWFSGAFDASQNPFVSVLVDGSAPLYFNVKALLHADQHLVVNGARYTLSLSPNIFHKMKSTINLKNDANSREAARFSVQGMLDAVSASGAPVTLSGEAYRFYYADGVGASSRMFVFICGSTSDFHVYLIPETKVPAEKMGVFSLFGGKRVGLSRAGQALRIYENP